MAEGERSLRTNLVARVGDTPGVELGRRISDGGWWESAHDLEFRAEFIGGKIEHDEP